MSIVDFSSIKVVVLLAAYNGEQYLKKQVESIVEQSYAGQIDIVIRDDGSKDLTCDLIRDFVISVPNRSLNLITHTSNKRGHLANFSALAQYAKKFDARYFAFADQDDVWHKEKIATLVKKAELLQQEFPNKPILVHSDLRVVDKKLNEIASSFVGYQGLPDPHFHEFPLFLVQNVVTGCTSLFNHELLQVASPIPEDAVVHDWWFGLCAYYWGKVVYIDKPLVDYRQHGKNCIGAISFAEQNSLFKPYLYQVAMTFPYVLLKSIKQSKALVHVKSKFQVNAEDKKWLHFYSKLDELTLFERLRVVESIFQDSSILKKAYLYCILILLPRFNKS